MDECLIAFIELLESVTMINLEPSVSEIYFIAFFIAKASAENIVNSFISLICLIPLGVTIA